MERYSSTRLLVALTLVLISAFGCTPKTEEGLKPSNSDGNIVNTGTSTAEEEFKLGNSNGNIMNGGMSAADGDWIYFCNVKENSALYKMKRDGSEETEISKDQAAFLNVMNGYIYYLNQTDGAKVYRIRPDGSERSLISDYPSINLITDGQLLYAIDGTDPEVAGKTGRIYRCKLDGTERTWVGEASASQFNLAENVIYYISRQDKSVHRIKTDGTEDQVIGDIKPTFIIVSGEKIYYFVTSIEESSTSSQIWSVGLDGTGAVGVSEDIAISMNISGDWIYYSHSKEEMMAFEFKKMKLDGTEPTVINSDMPMALNIHGDLLAYLQMNLATFSFSQVFVKTDGTGRKEFIMTSENTPSQLPGEDPSAGEGKTYKKNEKVVGPDMTLTVDRLTATNLLTYDELEMSRFLHSKWDDNYVIIRFTVTNDGEVPLELNQKVGIIANNSKDGGEYTLWVNMADVTALVGPDNDTVTLEQSQYRDSMIIQPNETRIMQAMGGLDVRSFPVNFSLFDGREAYATILLEPDEQVWAIKPAKALQIIQKWLVGREMDVNALEPDFKVDGTELELFYPFEAKGSEGKVEYYLLDGITRDIYSGKLADGKVVPVEIVGSAPEELPKEEPSGDPITYDTSQKVEFQDITVTVNSVYGTDVRNPLGGEPIVEKHDISTYLFVNFTVSSHSDIPIQLEDRFGILERYEKNGEGFETGWNVSLADITDREDEISKDRYLPKSEYSRELALKPGETLEVQAECGIEGDEFPVLFTLRTESGKDFAYIRITPDPAE